jgi:hypothetical protein
MMIGRHHPAAMIELWGQDEGRIGLFPIVRRVWAERGKRPVAIGRQRYEWVYTYAFVHPTSGRVEWLLLPTVNTELFQLALDYFASAVGAGPQKHIVVVLDQAGWHTSKQLKIPHGIHLIPQPAYSPELQPAEHLWPLLHEGVANEEIKGIGTLEKALVKRCRQLSADHEIVNRHTLFDWWFHAAEAERLST